MVNLNITNKAEDIKVDEFKHSRDSVDAKIAPVRNDGKLNLILLLFHRDNASRPHKMMDTRRTKRNRPSPPNNEEEAVSPTANVGSTSTEPQPRASHSDTITLGQQGKRAVAGGRSTL